MKIKLILFTLMFLALYAGAIWSLDRIEFGGESMLEAITFDKQKPGFHLGQSLKRYREIKNFQNIDILFAGSSHAYRGFDPRIFKKAGYTSFNLGSTAQTALNSYFLIKRFYDQLNPKLVIYEIYFGALVSEDGLESYYDLLNNTEFSYEIIEMALATRNPHSLNAMMSTYLDRLATPFDKLVQQPFPGEKYIRGGYCETELTPKNIEFEYYGNVSIPSVQLEYLTRIINYVHKKGAEIIFVTHPLPKELRATVHNYQAIQTQLRSLAEDHDVLFYDFNDFMELETYKYFKDDDHLNATGVTLFNHALLNLLRKNKVFSKFTTGTNKQLDS